MTNHCTASRRNVLISWKCPEVYIMGQQRPRSYSISKVFFCTERIILSTSLGRRESRICPLLLSSTCGSLLTHLCKHTTTGSLQLSWYVYHTHSPYQLIYVALHRQSTVPIQPAVTKAFGSAKATASMPSADSEQHGILGSNKASNFMRSWGLEDPIVHRMWWMKSSFETEGNHLDR